MKKLVLPVILAVALMLCAPLGAIAGGEDNTEALKQEIEALKTKLSEMDQLKAKLAELEARLDKNDQQTIKAKEVTDQHEGVLAKLKSKTDIDFGGAVRFNYRNTDYNDKGKSRGGDLSWDIFRLNVDGSINDILVSAEYRWYSYMDVLHHAWMGYNFSESWQGQLGVTQVPFGLLPWASHNYWFSLAYYVGLEDDYDLGAKVLYKEGPLDIQMAFFKNEEWGNPADLERYSIDVVTSGNQQNQESNQINARVAYTFGKDTKFNTEVGLSGQIGQLYNNTTDSNGSHWAAGAHVNGNYGPVNIMLEAARYSYDPDNPTGVDDSTVLMGAFGADYAVASEAWLYVAGIAYNFDVSWGPVTGLQIYDDFSMLDKDEDAFETSYINTIGCLISANPVYIYVDLVMGKNAIWVGSSNDAMALGDPDAEWQYLFNINFGYYF